MRAAIYTLGCKVNQYETQAMEKLLAERGHTVTDFDSEADVYVVNTCSVTAVSDQKSRQAVRRVRREHPEALVAVCGCFSQTHPEDARRLGADLVAGSGDRTGFVTLLEQLVECRRAAPAETRDETPEPTAMPEQSKPSPPEEPPVPVESLDNALTRRTFEVLPPGRLSGRTRAMLKVEDGCANFCAYCVIPYARGPVRSAPPDTAVRQAKVLGEQGVREIVLTGIEISSWGRDLKTGQSLIDLTEAVCRAVPEVRVRLGSMEPRTITEEFCRRAAALPNLCPQFHLSLQSGCDDTLRRMNRKYDTARFALSADLLRRTFDRPALTTDVIVGFPGETEEEFSQTLDFLRRCAFARVHVFPYSPRPGTPAAAMVQIPAAVKSERARRAADVAAGTRRAYLEGCVGQRYPVLFEQPRDGRFFGHAPNYMEVCAAGTDLRGQVRTVRVLSADDSVLYGVIEEDGGAV